MRVLVTGAAGFIGSHIADSLLSRGEYVVGLDNFDPHYSKEIKKQNIADALKNNNYKFIEGDIRDQKLVTKILKEERIDAICHQAAKPGVRESVLNPILYNDINVNGTLNLLWTAKECGIKNFIFASSSSSYGNPSLLPVPENVPKHPLSPYGASKLAAEEYCQVFEKVYGMKTVVLIYSTVYGPRGRPESVITRFIVRTLQDRPLEVFGSGNQTRSFTFVSDVVNANILALDKNVSGVFNIGGQEKISVNDLIKIIENLMKKKLQVVKKSEKPGEIQDMLLDTSRAKIILGWKPETKISEGLRRHYLWLKQAKNFELYKKEIEKF